MADQNNDFSAARWIQPVRKVRWGLGLALLVFHAVVLVVMDMALSLNRMATLDLAVAQVSVIAAPLPVLVPAPTAALPAPTAAKPELKPAPQAPAQDPVAAPPQIAPIPAQDIASPNPAAALPVSEAMPTLPIITVPDSAPTAPLPTLTELTALPKPAEPLAVVLERYEAPPAVRLRYSVRKGGDSGKAELLWRTVPSDAAPGKMEYELVNEMTYFGFTAFKQTSAGTLSLKGLSPVRFGDKRFRKSEQAAHFDLGKRTVTFSNNRPAAPMPPLPAIAQDRVSLLLQLAGLFNAQPDQLKDGQTLAMPVVSTDELETWIFLVQNHESVAVPAGELKAIKLIRRPRREFDITLEVWLGVAQHHMPVRIRQTDSGGVTDLQLTSIESL